MNPEDSRSEGARLEHLELVTEAALAHLPLDDLLNELLERLAVLLDVDTVAVLLLEPGGDELLARAAKGLEEEVRQGARVPIGRGFAGRIAAERRPVHVEDVKHADIFNPILRESGVRSLLGVPLLVEGEPLGVLHVGSLTPRSFSPEEAQLLEAAAHRIAVAIDRTRLFDAERRALERLRRLQAVTEAALTHLSLDDLLEEILLRLRDLLNVDTVAILLLDAEANELVARAAKGLEEEVRQGVRIPVGRGFAGRVVAERRPVRIEDVEHADILNPLLREHGIRSLLGVPLIVEGEPLGVLHVGSLTDRVFGDDDVQLLQLAADRIALGIDHARLYEAERTARTEAERSAHQIRQLQRITEAALAHLTLDDALLGELLERIREILEVDTAAILLLDEETGELVARAARGLEEEVKRGVRIQVGRGFAGRIAAERQVVILPSLEGADVVNPLLREHGIKTLMGAPLLVEGRVIGVLHVGTLTPREFTQENSALLQLAADRIAVAIDHARLYEREHHVAETLQRSLLPTRLPEVPGLTLAARYLPGSNEGEVGGDWYDVLTLGDGRVGLVMGDVVSRGLLAASVMGQLRNALRAYALDGYPPSEVLERLLRVTRNLDRPEMATLVYAILDPAAGTLLIANAGHPPPLVLEADGHVRYIEEGRSVPLGALAHARYGEAEATLEPGSTILLYTDGLVERRDMWLAEGLDRLSDAARGASDDPDALCDGLLERLLGGDGPSDDVAMLAVRLAETPAAGIQLELPAVPDSLAPLRRTLRRWLHALEADAAAVQDILIAACEAAANSIEHAYGPVDAKVRITGTKINGDVAIAVRDFGRWRPPRGRNRGRGTLLMQELMDSFEVSTSDSGTEVRLRRELRKVA